MDSFPPAIDVVDSARSQFVGILFNWGLYGILFSQTCTYVASFSNDLRINKAIVFLVSALETVQTAILTYDIYNTFVLHFGSVDYLESNGHTWLAVPILGGIVGCIAELFYAWRINRISGSKWISGLVAIFSFVQLGTGIAAGLRGSSAQTVSRLRPSGDIKMILSGASWTTAMVACDVLIAVVMIYYVLKLRREFFNDSSYFVRRLLSLSVETGSVTALAAVTNGILFVGLPNSRAFKIPGYIIGKLYSISLLRVLNSRIRTECTAETFTLPISFENPVVSQNTESKCQGSKTNLGDLEEGRCVLNST